MRVGWRNDAHGLDFGRSTSKHPWSRGVRYGIMDEHAAEEARFLLRSLEDGYRLIFTRSALVFDFEKDGSEVEHVRGPQVQQARRVRRGP